MHLPSPVRRLAALALAGAALLAATSASSASAATSAGWNDWNCKPSARHPQPVVLAHGLGGNAQTNVVVIAPAFVSQGFCVYSTTYGGTVLGDLVGGLGDMRKSAAQLSGFVDKVLAATGASKVDIVGHSEGTTVPAYYLKFLGGAANVRKQVGLGANFKGTSLSGIGTLGKALGVQPILSGVGCEACSQYLTGSSFLKDLNDGGVAVPGPTYTEIVTRYDLIVTPYTSGYLDAPNAKNILLQKACPVDFTGHLGLAADPNAISLAMHELDPSIKAICVPYWSLGA